MDNRVIARQLTNRARYLEECEASLYRVRAYRRAAETILGLDEPVEKLVAERGARGLRELPGIGVHLARAIEALLRTGALPETMTPSSAKLKDATSAAPAMSARRLRRSGAAAWEPYIASSA